MKILLLIIILLMGGSLPAQITLYPAKGDRSSYYFNNDVWETEYNYKSPIVLKTFTDSDGTNIWIDNISLSQSYFIKLKDYIGSLPNIFISSTTRSGGKLIAFSIHFRANSFDRSKVDLFYIKNKIREYILGEKRI